MDNELLLFDRLEVIKQTIAEYGEDNFYLSFSGGKDSTVVHHLLDMALPNNKIPRVYSNTGIEYNEMVEWVKELQKSDSRIVIIKPSKSIKKTLEEVGYPFKSKEYSNFYASYKKHQDLIDPYIKHYKVYPEELNDYKTVHNLPTNVKYVVKQFFGKRERDNKVYSFDGCPNVLKYQFNEELNFKISDQCCYEMKEKPLIKWAKYNKKPHKITGLMRAEKGRRTRTACIVTRFKKVSFNPLAVMSTDWEDWFIEKYNIKLCPLYYEPYNFVRTGCKGCPFALQLQEQLDVLEKYFPAEKKQCEIIWEPVYNEYRRLGYRLRKKESTHKLF